jgi:hypothetical protein
MTDYKGVTTLPFGTNYRKDIIKKTVVPVMFVDAIVSGTQRVVTITNFGHLIITSSPEESWSEVEAFGSSSSFASSHFPREMS